MKGFVRGHKEGTAAKRATTQRAAAEEAGSNMDRYDETKRRLEKWLNEETGDDDGEEYGAIARLYGEAMEDGEKWFVGDGMVSKRVVSKKW